MAEIAAEEAALQVGRGCTLVAVAPGPMSNVAVGQKAGVDMSRGVGRSKLADFDPAGQG